jgi:hypothetical protein
MQPLHSCCSLAPVAATPDVATPPPPVEDPSPEGLNDLFVGMMIKAQYIDELKKGFTGAVTMGERDGPSLGGAQFTNEFRDYAKSMGYEIDRGMSRMTGLRSLFGQRVGHRMRLTRT